MKFRYDMCASCNYNKMIDNFIILRYFITLNVNYDISLRCHLKIVTQVLIDPIYNTAIFCRLLGEITPYCLWEVSIEDSFISTFQINFNHSSYTYIVKQQNII